MIQEHVFIGIPTLGSVTMGLASQIAQITKSGEDPRCRFKFTVCWIAGARPCDYARNLLVQNFLTTDATRLWFMDSDTIPPPNILDLLLMDADIVSGITPTWGNHQPNETPRPNYTVYAYDPEQRGMVHRPIYNAGIEEVDGVGTAMMLIKRHVLEDARMLCDPDYECFDGKPGTLGPDDAPPIFREVRKPNGQLDMSEDIDFCWRAKRLGYRVLVNHGVKCKHFKEVDVLSVIEWGLSMQEPAPSGEAGSSSGIREVPIEGVAALRGA